MAQEQKTYAKQLIGKTIVSKSGKKYGEVGNFIFEVKTGELLSIVLKNPTSFTDGLDLEKDEEGNLLIPHSAIVAIGDFIVVSEEDMV
jgi:sporulation protein YlmC with PRC-barrel domain